MKPPKALLREHGIRDAYLEHLYWGTYWLKEYKDYYREGHIDLDGLVYEWPKNSEPVLITRINHDSSGSSKQD